MGGCPVRAGCDRELWLGYEGFLRFVALLRGVLLVRMIRVGTECPPYGYRRQRDHTKPGYVACPVGWAGPR